ncbi:MAG: PD-(D/E)XK nuclease family protein [Myxococcota bacterium]|nr:PD-(D/E)XK nuclease family protein [Myxococcota bacterium]
MKPRAGLGIRGPVFTGPTERSVLGGPTWGPRALLDDLELRLGLRSAEEAESVRVPRWAARIKSLGDVRAFYARSLSVDELGTTAALLEWRDNLVDAGWNGSEIAGGGERLGALAAIEAHEPTQTAVGRADRLVRIERALERAPVRIYDSLELLEDAALWPRRWQTIFARLADRGTSISHHTWDLPGAPASSDLGLLQARLRGERREGTVRGDGTLLFLQGDTPDDLAELTAALLANGHGSSALGRATTGTDVVVRCLDAVSLERALVRHGLSAQGSTSESAWRPAMQVLPLAIELAFAPRDPNRVLELLTLPLGPLRGSVGARLARAVTRQPGIGGKEWTRQKAEAARRLYERHVRLALEEGASDEGASERARATVADRIELVEVWLEGPVAAETGAMRAELLASAARVRAWLKTRIRDGGVETYRAAYAHCAAFIEALGHDTRELYSQDDARQLVDHFARSEQPFDLSEEAAGRLGHVNHPAALLAPCDRVWMWCFVSAVERQPTRFRWGDDDDALRARLTMLSPVEALDGTLAALDAVHLCARWPDPAQRIANLDALRATAANYEARCAQEREAATVAGMLRYFEVLRSPSLQGDEILAADDQHVPADDGAVVVCTYHKAKGLEWPVVVLANLDRGERRDAFEVAPESLGGTFDPERPLAHRSIRYWPWPLGATQKAPLADAAAESPEGRLVSQREDKERSRLLYVGFTRARDHLVLAGRVSKQRLKTAWLDALCSGDGEPLVELPVTAADGTIAHANVRLGCDDAAPLSVRTRVYRLNAERIDGQRTLDNAPAPVWFARPVVDADDTTAHAAYRIVPSAGANDWPELEARVTQSRLGAIEHLPSAITCDAGKYEDDVLGNAVHAFLAADVDGLDAELRLERARELTQGAGLEGVVPAESLLLASDALRSWVSAKWPDAIWHREIPIERTIASDQGERRVSGIVDLLLETPTAYVIIDHKTFPAKAASAWRAKCAGFIPQLAAYAILLEAVGEKKVAAAWVHLPVGGGMVEVVLGQGGGG